MSPVLRNLVVPIHVAALAVGERDGDEAFARVAHDFSDLPNPDEAGRVEDETVPHLAQYVTPPPNEPAGMRAGVHLHWALPDALARGETSGGKVSFPVTPNRWLVVRISERACVGWVVESDYVWGPLRVAPEDQNSLSRVVPVAHPADPPPTPYAPPYRQIGRVFDLADWNGDQGGPSDYAPPRLRTAVGYGALEYAASYPHSPNVFGMWDPLDGIDTADNLAYLVVGWYGDREVHDPVWRSTHNPTTVKPPHAVALQELQDAMGWIWPDTGRMPEALVCSGVVQGLTWRRKARNIRDRTQEAPADVAVGHTLAEAVAALVAGRANDPGLEMPLLCFQLGLLEALSLPGGAADADEKLHQARFATRGGGSTWVIKPPESRTPGARTAEIDPATLDPQVAALLGALNAAQLTCDRLETELRSRRERVYSDWCKFMVRRHRPRDVSAEYDFIERERRALQDHVADLETARGYLSSAQDALTRQLRHWPDTRDLRLVAIDAPRYWQPNEPVVLVSGPLLEPSSRYGGDRDAEPVCANCAHVHAPGTDQPQPRRCLVEGCACEEFTPSHKLRCRMVMPSGLALDGRVLTADDVPALEHATWAVPDEVAWLVAEATLLDPNRVQRLAASAGKSQADVQTAQTAVLNGGLGPSCIGRSAWSQPWLPITLQWVASVTPQQPVGESTGTAAYPPEFITHDYELSENGVDFLPRSTPAAGMAQTYTGSAVLGARTDIDLRDQLDRYFAAHPDDPYKAALTKIREQLGLQGTMAQALTGFNQALLMQEQTLQLPVCDPVDDLYGQFSNRDVPAAVADANDTIPVPGWFFNPIRAGGLSVDELIVVDAFGQKFVPKRRLFPAASLRAPGDAPQPMLSRPRVTQPSRLLFRWAASPVRGWVLFNHLDDALAIYDTDGVALGSLVMPGKGAAVPFWQGAPGNAAAGGSDVRAALDALERTGGLSRELRQFVLAFGTRQPGYLGQLLDALDEAMVTINPGSHAENAGLSLLIGQPFALVRASLRLELAGLPALDQSWSAFDAALASGRDDVRAAAGLTNVQFPIRLGDVGSHDDGLLGYFIDDATESAYETFFAETAAARSTSGVVRPERHPLRLTPRAATDRAPALQLTMLLDPRGCVHATTGILPVKDITLPASSYARALAGLGVTFLTTPLLSVADVPAPSLPNVPGYGWSWIAPEGDGWRAAAIDRASPPALVPPTRILEGWLQLKKGQGTS